MDDLPMSPEDWLTVVRDAVAETGHGDEVLVAVESTMDAWRVTVNPVRTVPQLARPAPVSE